MICNVNEALKKAEKEMFITMYGEEEAKKIENQVEENSKRIAKIPYGKRPESIRAEIDRRNNLKQKDMGKNNFNDSKLEFRINENEILDDFNRIAKLLLLQKRLKINNVIARFTEIEFYYYCQQHDDNFTHEHTLNEGRWRFHNQGIDITIKGNSGFGGILIRGIEINDEYINGPRRVLFKIMDFLNPVNEVLNNFGLIDGDILDFQIFQTYRHGLVSPSSKMPSQNSELFLNANYRYIVTPQNFSKKQFAGAEQIAQRFNDRDLSIKFLGYNIHK